MGGSAASGRVVPACAHVLSVRRAAREQAERACSPTCQLGGGAGVQSKPSDTERAPKPDPSSAKQPRGFSQASRGMTPQGFASFPTGRQAAEGAPSRTRRRLSPAGETSGGRGGLGANILLEGSASAVTTNPFGGLGPRAPRRDARVNWPVCAQGQVPGHSARGPISPEVVSWGRPLLKKRERSLKTAFFFSLQDDGEENNPRLRVDGEPLEIKARAFAHVEFAGRGGALGSGLASKAREGSRAPGSHVEALPWPQTCESAGNVSSEVRGTGRRIWMQSWLPRGSWPELRREALF